MISKDIFADTKMIGNPRYTDFSCIFDSLLTHTASNELSILASDLIYSTKDMESTNPQKILNEAQALTTSVFKGHEKMDVLIIKLNADYRGNYYPYNTPSSGKYYEGNRPFYIMMVGIPAIMNKILTHKDYANFANFKKLQGFENCYCFTNATTNPQYSILLSDSRNRGRMKAKKDRATQIHALEGFSEDRDGARSMAVAVDLSGVLTSEESKLDKGSYIIESISDYYIEDIIPIDRAEMTNEISRTVPSATHIFIISTNDNIKDETITLSLRNEMPSWIAETNSDDDRNINNTSFAGTTFAFSYLMQGIYDSFFPSTVDPRYFSISLEIKN